MLNPRVRERVFERDQRVCVICGTRYSLSIQHRANRGMGGSKHLDGMSNLITMCKMHNSQLESGAGFAEVGRRFGWKVHKNRVAKPADIPVFYRPLRTWFYLDDDGSRFAPPEGEQRALTLEAEQTEP